VLRELAAEVTGHPPWLVSECYAAAGDLSEAVALLIPDDSAAQDGADLSLAQVMHEFVKPLARSSEADRKRLITGAWSRFDSDERFVYHKLIRGSFRIGVGKKLLTRALANLAGVEPGVMAHRLAGEVRPTPDFYRSLFAVSADGDESRPYPFFLAHQLDVAPESLGSVRDWIAEWKWDGVRAQLIKRAGRVSLWSRGEEVVTHVFPEIAAPASALPDGVVLDGEILIWSEGRPASFSRLQTRLNRNVAPTHQLALFQRDAAVFLAYDLLEDAGADLRDRPLAERRERLAEILRDFGDGVIRLSETIDAESWDDLAQKRDESVARGAEGLMLKRKDAIYGVGRTKESGRAAGWLKWKIDPCTVDAVMIAAQLGSGRRASLYTDYTFAVWDDRNGDRQLVPFAKAYSGLTNAEIEELDRWIRAHTTGRAGPVRMVEPARVFEIGFEGIRESGRHKSGVAVRFPRILRQRFDKPPAEADTLTALHRLIEERGW
jgi:DNA ligase-1